MRVVAVAHLIDNLPRALAEGAEGAESERAVVQVPMQVLLVHDLVVVANLLLERRQKRRRPGQFIQKGADTLGGKD